MFPPLFYRGDYEMKNEFFYPSADGRTQIHGIEWIPEGKVKGVLQMCHGMAEYIERYHDFAEFLCANGYYVVGHDHLGHGKSITGTDKLGFFHEKKGNEYVIVDIHSLRVLTEKKYPNLPYFILGHSMGSFLVRQYLGGYGAGLSGAIVMGTGDQPTPLLMAGKCLCRIMALLHGWDYHSQMVDGMAAGGYEKHFADETDGSNWLSRNVDNVRKYKNDPMCGYMFTVNAYYHMFSGMIRMNQQEKEGRISKSLPIFLVAGQNDPVGNYGKSVESVFKKYKECGMKDVMLKLYQNDRHEILNELDREQVYQDIWKWMEDRVCS